MDSLVSLFKAEPFKKEYEINGVKVTLRMLSRKEYDDVMSRANISADDIVSKEALIRRPVLGYSLQEINGVSGSLLLYVYSYFGFRRRRNDCGNRRRARNCYHGRYDAYKLCNRVYLG